MKTRNLCIGLMLSIVLIAVVGFSMIACSQPDDATTINFPDNTPGSLPAFTLNTAVHPGGVLLTWDIVKDAAKYEVWRQAAGGANVQIGTSTTETGYADIKTHLNDLKAGINYKYTVVAISQASTKVGSAPVVVQNSKAEKTVSFTADNLPAEITLTPVSNLKLVVTPSSNVLATWDADANPLVSYELDIKDTPDEFPNPQTVDASAYAFTLVGGTVADVIVRKVLFKPAANDVAFYSPSEDANAVITVFNLGSASVLAKRDSNALVNISLSNIPPDTGLASFELSRYKYAASSAENPTWIPVSLASARLIESDTDEGNTYEVYDTLPQNSENSTFVYRLVGKYPGVNQLRNVAYSPIVEPLYPVQSLAEITYEQHINGAYPGTPSTSVDDLAAFFLANHSVESEVAYTYFLKQTLHSNGMDLKTNITVDYDWVLITPEVLSSESTSGKTVKVTLPEARPTYSFKVVATGTGTKAGYIGQQHISKDIRLRQSIEPTGKLDYNNAGYFILTYNSTNPSDPENNYTQRGIRNNTSSQRLATVFSLNLSGLAGYGQPTPTTPGLLREGETLSIELVSLNGAPPQTRQNVTRTTATYTEVNGTPAGNIDDDANDYFFTIPAVNQEAVPGGRYEVRLYVNAK